MGLNRDFKKETSNLSPKYEILRKIRNFFSFGLEFRIL